MKKLYIVLFLSLIGIYSISAQTPSPISVQNTSAYNAAFDPELDTAVAKLLPYYGDLGVRRVVVADASGDGKQEIISTDYANGGRVHVIAPSESDPAVLEVIWSSKVTAGASGSTPRFPQVGDLDGDGKPEIIFEQNSTKSILVYEWIDDMQLWGSEPVFTITAADMKNAGMLETTVRFTRECFVVYDFDGDGKSEFIPYGDSPRKDIYIFGVDGDIAEGSFPSVYIEGGHPTETTNGRNWVGGSQWNSVPADIDGDGQIEIINHHWDSYAFWSIDVNGTDSYTYPDTNNANKAKIYHKYAPKDAVSYFGARPVDVNGDGRDEIVGTLYGADFDLSLLSFTPADTGVYIWGSEPAEVANRFGLIAKKTDLAALGGKTTAEFWPAVGGDLNKDGKDEIYTGGGRGINLIAVQYKGEGSLVDPNSYTSNLVYAGEGNDVFATYKIYRGEVVLELDTLYPGTDSMKIDTLDWVYDPTKIDTIRDETPFTSYIFADSVDLDGDGKFEIVLSQQSVYDSVKVNFYDWDNTKGLWLLDTVASHKIFNEYRKNIIVLENTGGIGVKDEGYTIVTPEDYKLEQNYPNPFNPNTNISFTLPIDKKVSLKIYDMLGKEVRTLINGELYNKGGHKVIWDGKNNSGAKVASGNYIARLEYGTYFQAIKMTLLK